MTTRTTVCANRSARVRRRGFRLVVLLALLALIPGAPRPAGSQSPVSNLLITNVDSGAAPAYTARASVLSPEGAGIADLPAPAFALTASDGTQIPIDSAQPLNGGIAAMIVADLGGLNQRSPRGASYQEEVERVARQFVTSLQQSSPNQEDHAGLIVTSGAGESKFGIVITPTADLGLVANSLEPIKSMQVEPATALYDGLNRALDLLAGTPGLESKRKVILLFSDGADQKFSGDAILGNIPVRAREGRVTIFCLQARKRGDAEAKNLSVLAAQSGGRSELMDDKPEVSGPKVEGILKLIGSQRMQYALAFLAVRPAGDYTLKLAVSAGQASYAQEFRIVSSLKPPQVKLIKPAAGASFAQPGVAAVAPITLAAEVQFPDGKPRDVTVEFRADDRRINEAARAPYQIAWQPKAEVLSESSQAVTHTLSAIVKDTWLAGQTAESARVEVVFRVGVQPTPTPMTITKVVETTVKDNYVLVAAVAGLVVVVIVLIIVFVLTNRRTRQQMKQLQTMARQPGGMGMVVKTLTRRLTPGKQAFAELEVMQGPMRGQMLPIDSEACWVGRDGSRCQITLQDDSVSGQHFQIIRDPGGQLFLLDEKSTNGTLVNQTLAPKGTRLPIQEGTLIQVGRTVMALRTGRGTRKLAQTTQRVNP
jgi:hypothetical protein